MTVTTVDNRTVVSDADSLTNWTGADTLDSTTKAEGTSSVCVDYNVTTGTIYYTPGTALDLDTDLLYVQSYTNALQNGWKESTLSDSSHMLYMNDGTNELALCEAGNDRDVFKHAGGGQVQFQSFLIDLDYLGTKDTNGEVYAISGSVASFVKTSVDDVGSRFVTLSKALGGGENCFVDIIRIDEVDTSGDTTTSTSGITIYGGGSGTEGTFAEVVADDISVTADKGFGVIREYTDGAYGCQGRLKFGTTNTLGNAYFKDSSFSLTFEDRDVNNDKFAIFFFGNSTDTQDFRLSDGTIQSAGPGVTIDASSANMNVLIFDTVSFLGLRRKVSFPTDSSTRTHDVLSCTFDDCDQIDPGTADFESCTISNYDETISSAGGAVLLDGDGTANWSGLDFISRGTGHAIYITATGSYTLTDFTYSGYGANDTTDAAVYNNSGGSVTLTISGGDNPTVRNGTGASTTVTNPKTFTLTVTDVDGTPISGARVLVYVSDGTNYPYEDTVSITGSGTTATVTHTSHGMATDDYVIIEGVENDDAYNGAWQITVTGTDNYTYTTSQTISESPATGTSITSTFCVLDTTTDVNGEASDTRTWGSDQAITGWARKSTSSPYYQQGVVVGTISSTVDSSASVVLVSDE